MQDIPLSRVSPFKWRGVPGLFWFSYGTLCQIAGLYNALLTGLATWISDLEGEEVSGLCEICICSVYRNSLILRDASRLSGWNVSRGFQLRQLCNWKAAGELHESSWQSWGVTEGLPRQIGTQTFVQLKWWGEVFLYLHY